MTPQDFKALLDVLMDINSNLEKIAKLEHVLLPLSELISDQRTVLSEKITELGSKASSDAGDPSARGGERE